MLRFLGQFQADFQLKSGWIRPLLVGGHAPFSPFNGKPHKMTFKLHFFDEVFQKLKNNIFVRVGKSLIVNKNYIYVINITSQELLLGGSHLRGDFKLKASREALKELKALIEQEGNKA